MAIANGIRSAVGAVKAAAQAVVDAAKSALPHIGSPLQPTWLRKSLFGGGKEMVDLIGKGIDRGSRNLSRDLGHELAVSAATSLGAPGAFLSRSAQPVAAGGDTVQHYNFNGPWSSGYAPSSDAREAVAQIATLLRQRGGLR